MIGWVGSAVVAYLSVSISANAQGTDSKKFETALKKELLSNHQRHIPKVTIRGNEVKLTYGPSWNGPKALLMTT